MGVIGRSRGRGGTQHIEEDAADGVAHLVSVGRGAPERAWRSGTCGFRISGKEEKDYCGGITKKTELLQF